MSEETALFQALVDGILISLVDAYWTVILTVVLASLGLFVYISRGNNPVQEEAYTTKPALRLTQSSSNIVNHNKKKDLSFTMQISNDLSKFQATEKKKRETVVDDMVNRFVRNRYKSEMKLPSFLSIKTVKKGVASVMKSYKQNEIYRKVTKSTKGGDGLSSIFNQKKNRRDSFIFDNDIDINKTKLNTSTSIIDFLNNEPFKEPTDEAIYRALSFHVTYSWIPNEMLKYIVSQVSIVNLEPGDILYSSGDTLNYTCVVVGGEIDVISESKNSLIEETDEVKDDYDYKLYPGHGSNAFSEVIQLITEGSFNAVVTLKASKTKTKVLKLTSDVIRHVDTIFPGFEEEFILKTLIRMNKETFFTLKVLSGRALLKNPDIHQMQIDDLTKQGALNEVKDMFKGFYDNGTSQAMRKPFLSKVIASELGIPLDKIDSYLTFKPFDVTLSVKRKLRYRRPAKLMQRSNLSVMRSSVLRVLKLDKGADVFKIVSETAILFVLKGSLNLCSVKPSEKTKFKAEQPTVLHRQEFELKKVKQIDSWQTLGHFSVVTASFDSQYTSKEILLSGNVHKDKQCLIADEEEGAVIICLEDEVYLHLLRGFPKMLSFLGKRITKNVITRQVREVEIALKRRICNVGEICLEAGIRTSQVSVVTHGRLMLRRTMPNKARTSVYSHTNSKIASGFNVPSAFGFGNTSKATTEPEPLTLKIVKKHPTKTIDLKIMRRGDTFGRFSLFTKSLNPFPVEAVRYTQLMCVPNTIMRKIFFGNSKSVHAFGSRLGSFMDILLSQDDVYSDNKKETEPKVFAVMPASIQANVDMFLHIVVEVLQNMGIKAQVLNSTIINKILQRDQEDMDFKDSMNSFLDRENSRIFSSFENFTTLSDLNIDEEKISFDEENKVYNVINEVEDANDIVFLVVDNKMTTKMKATPTWWSITCVRQSDVVLHVGNASDTYEVMPLEESLSNEALNCNLRRELVLLHFPDRTQSISRHIDPLSSLKVDKFKEPVGTANWIKVRSDISQHHHLRVHLSSGVEEISDIAYMNYYNLSHFKSDFRRFVRWILGKSVTLVLGGGGARGIAHLAILKVLEENGVPVDFVAGTSIGAFMAALYAWKTQTLYMYKQFIPFCREMSSHWRKAIDITIPFISYLTGYAFNKCIIRVFEDRKIEDLWLPFFCMSTDLTDSCEIAHRNGSLWRYVRASMTLVNLVPPLCDVEVDPFDPSKKRVHYLGDGGYMNNLPVDVMRNLAGDKCIVIAVDIQSDWSIEGDDYGETFSGFKYLLDMLNPFTKTPSVPTNFVIQTQLAFVASVRQGGVGEYHNEEDDSAEFMSTGDFSKVTGTTSSNTSSKTTYTDIFHSRKTEDTAQKRLRDMIDLFLHPPVEKYGTLEFGSRKEIEALSEAYAKPAIEQWLQTLKTSESDKLTRLFGRQ